MPEATLPTEETAVACHRGLCRPVKCQRRWDDGRECGHEYEIDS
jgi:hypothetical protein